MAGCRVIEDENGELIVEDDCSQVTEGQEIDENTPCGSVRKKRQTVAGDSAEQVSE